MIFIYIKFLLITRFSNIIGNLRLSRTFSTYISLNASFLTFYIRENEITPYDMSYIPIHCPDNCTDRAQCANEDIPQPKL